MILRLRDTDGDVLAVDTAAIVAVGVGVAADGVSGRCTLIYSLAGPLTVENAVDEVIGAWELSRIDAGGQILAHTGLIGWQQQYAAPSAPGADPRVARPQNGGQQP